MNSSSNIYDYINGCRIENSVYSYSDLARDLQKINLSRNDKTTKAQESKKKCYEYLSNFKLDECEKKEYNKIFEVVEIILSLSFQIRIGMESCSRSDLQYGLLHNNPVRDEIIEIFKKIKNNHTCNSLQERDWQEIILSFESGFASFTDYN